MLLKIQVFGDVTPVLFYLYSRGKAVRFLTDPDGEGMTLFRNVGKSLPCPHRATLQI